MKNIHVLPTDKPSRLYLFEERLILGDLVTVVFKNSGAVNQNIYITDDSEIKVGDWCLDENVNIVKADKDFIFNCSHEFDEYWKKIILTTDQDLIADGIQAIDDEFLEWFVKNPSCEEIKTLKTTRKRKNELMFYKIIIPKEEPKQEPGREIADYIDRHIVEAMVEVAKQKLYSEEEVEHLIHLAVFQSHCGVKDRVKIPNSNECAGFVNKWFEQHKKK
jgi:hypothetical protein